MKNVKFLSLIVLMAVIWSSAAQNIDCQSILNSRKATPFYTINKSTRSISCITGKKYELSLSLEPGKEYRISFFASSILDNRMTFQLINAETGEKFLDVPGQTAHPKKGECALREYFDYATGKMVYPFFEFFPEEKLNLKVIIDIPEYTFKIKTALANPESGTEDVFEEFTEKRRGCVSLFVQEKETEMISCQ
jgi:hypothetical protein